MKPYKDSSNIRVFSKEVDPMDLIWHTDLEDRLVDETTSNNLWSFYS